MACDYFRRFGLASSLVRSRQGKLRKWLFLVFVFNLTRLAAFLSYHCSFATNHRQRRGWFESARAEEQRKHTPNELIHLNPCSVTRKEKKRGREKNHIRHMSTCIGADRCVSSFRGTFVYLIVKITSPMHRLLKRTPPEGWTKTTLGLGMYA